MLGTIAVVTGLSRGYPPIEKNIVTENSIVDQPVLEIPILSDIVNAIHIFEVTFEITPFCIWKSARPVPCTLINHLTILVQIVIYCISGFRQLTDFLKFINIVIV